MNTPADIPAPPAASAAAPASGKPRGREVIYRHRLAVRLTHWLNALVIAVLLGSGLNIFNAHPRLYWGARGDEYDAPFLWIHAETIGARAHGVVELGPLRLDGGHVLGWSKVGDAWTQRAWPDWLTIPSFQDLADARHWHFFFAWILVANGLAYLTWSLASGHLRRDLAPTRADIRAIPRSILDHLKLKHPVGEAAKRYNVLQRLAYLAVIALVAGMIATGLAMSPGIDATAPWLVDGLGGRQSARALHFIFASLIVAFVTVHLIEVVLAGPLNEIGSMITGRYRLPKEH